MIPRRASMGLAMIVVVGVLGVLSVLATAFVTMAQLERKASLQRLNAAKAYLLARSGIEDALARMERGQDPAYLGEDWNASGTLDGIEVGAESYRVGLLDTDGCPAKYALRPSFFVKDATGMPRVLPVDGKARGFSGRLAGDRAPDANHYALKVASKDGFYINGGHLDAWPAEGYNAVLWRMLGTLAEAVGQEPGVPVPLTRRDGENLISSRPPGTGWQTWDQVRDLALGRSQAKLDALRPYLALDAWVDRHVIHPNAQSTMVDKDYHSWGEIKLDHGGPPDFERMRSRIVGRAPVNLAWARKHRPALIALIGGLKGLYLDEMSANYWGDPSPLPYTSDIVGTVHAAEISLDWTQTSDDCRRVADAILTSASDLGTWQDWNAFCDSLSFPPPVMHPLASWATDLALPQAKRDILKANFNPNSDLNKFNPNTTFWKSVDKSDLLVYSTEFSLFPVQGWDLSCTGRVLDLNGKLLASRTLKASVPGASLVRLSTQKEFVCENLGDLDLPGDESNPRRPGVSTYLSESQGTTSTPTWGHTLSATGWMDGTSQGVGLQTYPEPYYNDHTGVSELWINPADYDGNLQLATIETPKDYFYEVDALNPPPPTLSMTMLARFDDGFDLDLGTNPNPAYHACRADSLMVWTTELNRSLLDATKPSTLYPDGAYSETGRAPAFYDEGNCDGYHGALSVWVKRNYQLIKPLSPLREHAFVMRTNDKDGGAGLAESTNQFFFLGDAQNAPGGVSHEELTLFLEVGRLDRDYEVDPSTPSLEHMFRSSGAHSIPHVWTLATAAWEFRCDLRDTVGKVLMNDSFESGVDAYGDANTNNAWDYANDITAKDNTGKHLLSLGTVADRDFYQIAHRIGQGADATFDELILYDFGGASKGKPVPDGTLQAPKQLAQNRYKDGRYYKENGYRAPGAPPLDTSKGPGEAASWISGPITLPAGTPIKELRWTWYRPAELPTDYAEVELLKDTATDYLWTDMQSRSTLDSAWTRDRQDWTVNRTPVSPFRLRVVFRRDTVVDANTPILDSPVLDDLTLVLQPAGGARLRTWQDGD